MSRRPPPDFPESHDALDLSRRKHGRARLVRASLVHVRRAAAPYATATRIALARLVRHRLAHLGLMLLAAMFFVAVFADFLASDLPLACRYRGEVYLLPNLIHPAGLAGTTCTQMRKSRTAGDWAIEPVIAQGPGEIDEPGHVLSPPFTRGHPFGTDAVGRDLFARVVHGTRTALSIGLGGSIVLVLIGVGLGAASGFLGGLVDAVVSRTVESLTAIPTLLLVLVVGALVPRPTTATLLWTIALTRWTELARLVRADVLVALGQDYVTAARALGASPGRILTRHVLPNTIAPALVAAAFGVASIVLMEAAVDFLRMGSPDAVASWGESLGEARTHFGAWWLIVFPGAGLLTTLIALNLLGEAARDALDPKFFGPAENN